MNTQCDVLGLGCIAVDDLLYVEAYPPADAKCPVRARERHCGGLTATALVAAARLGARCAYAGTFGDNEASRFVAERFRREGVDVSHVVRRREACPCLSVIIVDERRRTRNIFHDTRAPMGADLRRPARSVIAATRVLLVDRFGVPGMMRAARIARAAGVAVVADFENRHWKGFDDLFLLPDHLILSAAFAREVTRAVSPCAAVNRLWNGDRQVVVVTCGAHGCWYRDTTMASPAHRPAFKVKAKDTTGCGDVFHGAYAAALAWGLPLADRIRWASATAALKATRRGGQAGIPSRSQVEAFLRQQK